MNVTEIFMAAVAMLSVASLPFVMAWVEQTLMTNSPRVKETQR